MPKFQSSGLKNKKNRSNLASIKSWMCQHDQ